MDATVAIPTPAPVSVPAPVKNPPPSKKAAPKKAAPKKSSPKKAAPKSVKAAKPAKKNGPTAADRKKDLIRAMRQMKATSAGAAVAVADLSAKIGGDAYGLIAGASGQAGSNPTCLLATGHVKSGAADGRSRTYYLTAKGQKTDFSEYPFVRVSKQK